MKISKLTFLVFILLVGVIAGCSSQTEGSESRDSGKSNEPIVLTAGGISAPKASTSRAGEKFAELVGEKTNGEVKIEFYPAEQLGTGGEQLQSLMAKSQDILINTLDFLSTIETDYNVLTMPYLFDDMNQFKNFLDSDIHKELKDRVLEKYNIRILAHNLYRSQRLIQSTEPIKTPEDMVGMKFRVPDIPIFIEHAKQLEGIPVPIAWGETYMGFQQGLAQVHDPTLETIYSSKFHEVAPFIMETNHGYSSAFIMIEDDSFQQLSKEHQDALLEAANEAGIFHEQIVQEELDEQVAKIKEEGGKFIEVDREAFREKVFPMAEKMEEKGLWSKGLVDRILELDLD